MIKNNTFNKGDRIRCINTSEIITIFGNYAVMLTEDKIYTCIDDSYIPIGFETLPDRELVFVTDDEGETNKYYVYRFIIESNANDQLSILEQFKNPNIDYFIITRDCSSI